MVEHAGVEVEVLTVKMTDVVVRLLRTSCEYV